LTKCYSGSGNDIICNFGANGYRLPTEAEWEYSCRADSTTPFSTGDIIYTFQANYKDRYPFIFMGEYRKTTVAVNGFEANAFGLYNMHGNVWEWCWDWYNKHYYKKSTQNNPEGPLTGSYHVVRGGSWNSNVWWCRSACRNFWYDPVIRCSEIGFRLCKTR
jgi:sulfatase modifying factor 1